MKNLLYVLSAFVFTFLFHNESLGLNIFIFNILMLSTLALNKELHFKTSLSKTILLSFLFTSFAVVWSNSNWAVFMHFLNWIILIGNQNYNKTKSIGTSLIFGLRNVLASPKLTFKSIFFKTESKASSKSRFKIGLYLIPVLVIFVFLMLFVSHYRYNNYHQ